MRLKSIRLRDVGVRFGAHWALRDVSFELRSGEHWLLVGANGAGKTALLKLLRGDLWPTPTPGGREQREYQLGRDRHLQPALVREHIAYLGPERQDRYERYDWNLPVADVVATGLFDTDILLEQPTARQRSAVTSALRDVGLAGLAARGFLTLSYGQRRRVLLARALVRGPDVLLLDEALNGLDAASRRAFMRSLRRAAGKDTAWVLSSHRRADIPSGVTHGARLERGAIRAAGPIAEVRAEVLPASSRRQTGSKPPASSHVRDRGGRDLLRLHAVTVYRDGRCVVPRFDWTIAAGQHWCITGPNGCGKSTLISLLYGDLWPALGGSIERWGMPSGAPISDWKRRVGCVSPELQAAYAATACTVEEIVLSGLQSSIGLDGPPTTSDRGRARRALRRVGLSELSARHARQLSYGQLRLALLARALVCRRRLLLLDEPFDGLDADATDRAHALVESAVRGGAQVVLATHHREDVPSFVNHRLELRKGRRPAAASIAQVPSGTLITAAAPLRRRSRHRP
jgi:molybdate transport system ATP-binding protein